VKKPFYHLSANAEENVTEETVIGFRLMCETIALSTVSYFSFTPDKGAAKQKYAKSIGKSAKSLTGPDNWETHATPEEKKGVYDAE